MKTSATAMAATIALVLCAGVVSSSPVQRRVGMSSVSAGQYLLVVNGQPNLLTVTATGSVTTTPLQQLTVSGVPPTDPVDPVDPVTPGTEFQRRLTTASRNINEPVVAGVLAVTFRQLADQIDQGKLSDDPPGTISDVTTRTLDVVMLASSQKAKWRQVRDFIGEELTKRAQAGTLNYSAAYKEIATALAVSDSVAGQQAINPVLIALIIKIVLAIITGGGISPELIAELIGLIFRGRSAAGML